MGEIASFASEVAENLPARREPQYPTEGGHRGYKQDWQRQITTFLSPGLCALICNHKVCICHQSSQGWIKKSIFSPWILALVSQTENSPSFPVNKEKADMETKSRKAGVGRLVLTPCSVTAENSRNGFHRDFIQKQREALNLLRNSQAAKC